MKNWIFVGLSVILSATQLLAQGSQHNRHSGQAIQQFAEELALSATQKEELRAIRTTTQADLEALRAKGLPEADQRAQAKTKIKAAREKSLAVLSPSQREKLSVLQAEAKAVRSAQFSNRLEMRTELEAYHEKEISPVLKKARLELEKSISKADRQEIERLRAVLANRPTSNYTASRHKGARRPSAQQAEDHSAHKAWRAAHQADFEKLNVLTQRYEKEIAAIFGKLAPQKEQWQKDKTAIRDKYTVENQRQNTVQQRTPDRQHPRGGAWRENREESKYSQRKYSRFLLLDSDNIPNPAARNIGKSSAQISVSPNPASGQASIQINAQEAGDILLRLVSEDGRLVKQISKQYLAAGNHTLPLALEGLASGRYTLVLNDKAGRVATSVIVR